MNAWEALVRQALVGNNVRNKNAFALLEQLEAHGFTIDKNVPAEKRLLQAAALQQYLHATASEPLVPTIPPPKVALPESKPYCSEQRATQLHSILNNGHDEILIEWMAALTADNEVVLPELLPELLDYCIYKQDSLQAYLPAILGTRGEWLTTLAPHWNYASSIQDDNHQVFLYGERSQRLHYLKQIAQQNPATAFDLLQQVWEEEGYVLRAAFLKIFNPLPPFAPALAFWEKAAKDKRKTVRQQAIGLLKFFPESSVVTQLQKQLQKWVHFPKDSSTPSIQLPTGINAGLRNYGITAQRTWLPNQGVGANILAQVIASVPPQWWESTYPWTRTQWVAWLSHSEWATVFVVGWARAAQTFQTIDWLLDCQAWFLNKALKHEITATSFEFLYEDLPNDLFQQMADATIDLEEMRPFTDEHPLFTLLLVEGQNWSESFSKYVLKRLQLSIEQESYVFKWTLKSILKKAAYAIPPSLYEFAQYSWPTECTAWPSWQREVKELLNLLKFRSTISPQKQVD